MSWLDDVRQFAEQAEYKIKNMFATDSPDQPVPQPEPQESQGAFKQAEEQATYAAQPQTMGSFHVASDQIPEPVPQESGAAWYDRTWREYKANNPNATDQDAYNYMTNLISPHVPSQPRVDVTAEQSPTQGQPIVKLDGSSMQGAAPPAYNNSTGYLADNYFSNSALTSQKSFDFDTPIWNNPNSLIVQGRTSIRNGDLHVDILDSNSVFLPTLNNFGKGLYDAGESTVKGIWDIVNHPIDTAQNLKSALLHPIDTGSAIWKGVSTSFEEDVINGNTDTRARFTGRAIGELGLLLVGTKGADKAAKLSRSGKFAAETENIIEGYSKSARASIREKASQVMTNAEKGALGEEAADLTMERAGYDKLSSKIRGNQGFDGVYVKYGDNSEIQDIIVNESKFNTSQLRRNVNGTLQMSQEWIENNIELMMKSPDSEVRATAKILRENMDMIRTKLNRLTPDGVNKWETDPGGWGQ